MLRVAWLKISVSFQCKHKIHTDLYAISLKDRQPHSVCPRLNTEYPLLTLASAFGKRNV